MNNIELRLTAERNWREKNLQKCIKNQGKKTSGDSVWKMMNSYPSLFEVIIPFK